LGHTHPHVQWVQRTPPSSPKDKYGGAIPDLRYMLSRYGVINWSPLWSSGQSSWLQIQRTRVRFTALPDFLNSSGSCVQFRSYLEEIVAI
jgi:hypothetical protein